MWLTGKTTPPPPDGKAAPSPIKHVEKQPQAKHSHLRPQAKLNLEGDEKIIIGKSMADPSLVGNFIPKGKLAFQPVDTPADGTLVIPGSSTMSDNPNLIRPAPESSKAGPTREAPHEHKKAETKDNSVTKLKKPRSVDDGSKEKIAPKKSPVEVHKQESGSKGKARGNEHKKKPRSADAIEPVDKLSPKKKSADNRKSNKNKNQHGSPKEIEQVSPPVVGKKTRDSKTKTNNKGSQTKVAHTKTGDHKSNEKVIVKTIVPGEHHGKSKTKSDDKHKPKSADK